jgi:hypothetical protein
VETVTPEVLAPLALATGVTVVTVSWRKTRGDWGLPASLTAMRWPWSRRLYSNVEKRLTEETGISSESFRASPLIRLPLYHFVAQGW